MPTSIRPFRPADTDEMYDVCLRTGADGADARPLYRDPRLLGSIFVGPYLAFEPELAFVLDDGGRARGYVLGALDTVAFDRVCERTWWPELRARYSDADLPAGGADAGLVAMLTDLPATDPAVVDPYPSHLHIDLLPPWQGAGWGRRLIDTLLAALAAAGSPGVHLGVSATNTAAVGFYRRLGFEELRRTPGGLTMGRRLDRP